MVFPGHTHLLFGTFFGIVCRRKSVDFILVTFFWYINFSVSSLEATKISLSK